MSGIKSEKNKEPPAKKTRSGINPDIDFKAQGITDWESSGHLPTFSEVIGGIRSLVNTKTNSDSATWTVSHALEKDWIARNIYPESSTAIHKKLKKEFDEFMLVRKLVNKGNVTTNTMERYEKLRCRKDQIYDIFVETESDKACQGSNRNQ